MFLLRKIVIKHLQNCHITVTFLKSNTILRLLAVWAQALGTLGSWAKIHPSPRIWLYAPLDAFEYGSHAAHAASRHISDWGRDYEGRGMAGAVVSCPLAILPIFRPPRVGADGRKLLTTDTVRIVGDRPRVGSGRSL